MQFFVILQELRLLGILCDVWASWAVLVVCVVVCPSSGCLWLFMCEVCVCRSFV